MTARSQKIQGTQVLSSDWDENLECELHYTRIPLEKTVAIHRLKQEASRQVDMEQAYALARKVELHNGLGSSLTIWHGCNKIVQNLVIYKIHEFQ